MSATTMHSTDNTTEAWFLAPGTHQRSGSKGKGKGQGTAPANNAGKGQPKGRAAEPATTVEDEAFASGELVLIPLSRLVPSAFNVRKTGGEDVTELAALIKAQGLLQNLIVHPDETKRGKATGNYGVAAGGRRLRALGLLAKAGGVPAYEAAGGVVVRDLFEDAGSGYFTDAELLQRLAIERLTAQAQDIKAEGWAWAEARTSFDYSERQGFGVATMKQRAPSPEQYAERDALLNAKEQASEALAQAIIVRWEGYRAAA